jgi:hypothetical protein
MIYMHTAPPKTTAIGDYYSSFLKTSVTHIGRKGPELFGHWMLRHDNARPHIANIVIQFLASRGVQCIPHAPYCPDLVHCDFVLFPILKRQFRGQRFQTTDAAAKLRRRF